MNPNRFVFDTNTFISAALIAGSVNARALDLGFKIGKVTTSNETFAELTEVIFRKKFDRYLSEERKLQVLEKLEKETPSELKSPPISTLVAILKTTNFLN